MADVLFVQDLFYEYLGVTTLSARLKAAGITTDVLIENRVERVAAEVERLAPKVVAFSVISGIHRFPVAASRVIRERLPAVRIVAGGPHPTFCPDYLEHGAFDAVCVGEGDHAIVPYFEAATSGRPLSEVPNLRWRDGDSVVQNPLAPLVEDLDSLPFPDRALYDKYPTFRDAETKGFVTSRGCPLNCTFCYNRDGRRMYHGLGRFHRMRSPANVVEEIRQARRRWPAMRTVLFIGDVVFHDRRWAREFLELYAESVDLPFAGLVAANAIDEEIGALLKRARCHCIFFGIETGNERVRREVLKKPVSNAQIEKAAEVLRRNGIAFRTFNMLGIPTETIDDMIETIRFNARIGARHPWCSIFVPYPGTELFEVAVRAGELSAGFSFDDLPSSYMERCVLDRPDRERIENLHKLFPTAVKHPWTLPLVRRLMDLPPNLLFKLWFGVGYMNTIRATERRRLASVAPIVARNLRLFITGGRGRSAAGA